MVTGESSPIIAFLACDCIRVPLQFQQAFHTGISSKVSESQKSMCSCYVSDDYGVVGLGAQTRKNVWAVASRCLSPC